MILHPSLALVVPAGGYVRTGKTASGATAVQIVHGSRRGSRTIEHLGSAHDERELAALKAAARQRLAARQQGWTSAWTRRRATRVGRRDRRFTDAAPVGGVASGLRRAQVR